MILCQLEEGRAIGIETGVAPRVSVLMPTRGRVAYIGEAVASVLGQTLPDLELLVLDGGSTDGTLEILAGFDDPRLRVLRQEGEGISAALNTGLRHARGAWVARNDDDDVWLPHLLETLVPSLEGDPELALVYGRCREIDARGRPRQGMRGNPLRFPDDPFRSLLYSDYTASIASIYQRAVLAEIGGWGECVSSHEDWDLALRVARTHPVRFVDRVVAHFRRHPGNVTRLDRRTLARHVGTRRLVLERAFEGDRADEAQGLRGLAWRNLYIGEGHQWLSVGDWHEAFDAYRQAWAVGASRLATAGRIAWSMADWFVVPRVPAAAELARRALQASRRARGAGPRGSPPLLPPGAQPRDCDYSSSDFYGRDPDAEE